MSAADTQSAMSFSKRRKMAGRRMFWPVIGVITSVRYADDPQNQSRLSLDSKTGAMLEASVMVIDDGNAGEWEIPRCAISQAAVANYHDYAEDPLRVPRDLTTGEPYSFNDGQTNPAQMDGDFCLVQFIGGSVDKAVITARWPHPLNNRDPSTAGWNPIAPSAALVAQAQAAAVARQQAAAAAEAAQEAREAAIAAELAGATTALASADAALLAAEATAATASGTLSTAIAIADPASDLADTAVAATMTPVPDTAAVAQIATLTAALSTPTVATEALAALSALLVAAAVPLAPPDTILELAKAADIAIVEAKLGGATSDAAVLAAAQYEQAQAQALVDAAEAADAPAVPVGADDAVDPIVDPNSPNTLDQKGRLVRRLNGLTLVVSRDGDTWLDANTCGRELNKETLALDVDRPKIGGAITVNLKPGKPFEFNYNPPPLAMRSRPWVPQVNPPQQPDGVRADTKTRFTFTDDDVDAIAGGVLRLMARGGTDALNADSVELGGTPQAPPTLHAAIAEPLKTAFDVNATTLDGLVDAVNEVRIRMGLPAYIASTVTFPDAAQSAVVKVK